MLVAVSILEYAVGQKKASIHHFCKEKVWILQQRIVLYLLDYTINSIIQIKSFHRMENPILRYCSKVKEKNSNLFYHRQKQKSKQTKDLRDSYWHKH